MAQGYGFHSQYNHSKQKLPVPYHHATPYGLPANTMVTVMGQVPRHADRFNINLATHGQQTLLHINPRFSDSQVVRNSNLEGSWGPEERHGGMPLKRGEPFGCIILAQEDRYMIAFNGQHFTEFQFRAPNAVTSVDVGGDVILNQVEIASNPMMPMPGFPPQGFPPQGFPPSQGFPPPSAPGQQNKTVIYSHLQVPFQTKFAGGMHEGREITLSCIPKHNAERIRIDLCKDKEASNIAFHMDIRFKVGEHRRIICLNSFKHGHWEEEDRYQTFPFRDGVGFDLTLTSQGQGYLVKVNGAQIAYFNHKDKNPQNTNHLHIQGDLKITRVAF